MAFEMAPAGNPSRAGYITYGFNAALTGATDDLCVIEAPALKQVRLRKITVYNPGMRTAAAMHFFVLTRTTAAGVGGAVTPSPIDGNDPAYGGIVRIGAAVAGALGTELCRPCIWIPAALGAAQPFVLYDGERAQSKAILIPKGVANGLTLRNITAGAGSTGFNYVVEFSAEDA